MCSLFAASSKVMPLCHYWRRVAHDNGIAVKEILPCASSQTGARAEEQDGGEQRVE